MPNEPLAKTKKRSCSCTLVCSPSSGRSSPAQERRNKMLRENPEAADLHGPAFLDTIHTSVMDATTTLQDRVNSKRHYAQASFESRGIQRQADDGG